MTTSEKYQEKLARFKKRQEERKERERKKKLAKKKKKKKIVSSEEPKPKKVKKKKVGRPKKRGPKKKRIRRKIVKIERVYQPYNFKIVSSLNGKQNGYIGQYHDYAEAYRAFELLKEKNKSIRFPRKFINKGDIKIAKDEYLMLEKNLDGNTKESLVRNEFGKYVKHVIINNEKWLIRDKMNRLVEETFWIYGYDPKLDRKDVSWIIDSLLFGSLEDKYSIIRIAVYKNKLIIRYDNREIGMVLCKNKSDCIRLYNFLQKETNSRQIVFIGSYDKISDRRRELEAELLELTGWTKIKLQRSTN